MADPVFCSQCTTRLEPRVSDGKTRLACPKEGCGFIHYGNPLPVVGAVVEHNGEVILVRNVGWPEKWFGLVTGFLEAGETPEQGILRELREELGLEGTIQSLIGVYAFPMRNELIVTYHVVATGSVTLGAELADYKRVAPDKLRPWPMGTGEAVRDWLARRNPTGGSA